MPSTKTRLEFGKEKCWLPKKAVFQPRLRRVGDMCTSAWDQAGFRTSEGTRRATALHAVACVEAGPLDVLSSKGNSTKQHSKRTPMAVRVLRPRKITRSPRRSGRASPRTGTRSAPLSQPSLTVSLGRWGSSRLPCPREEPLSLRSGSWRIGFRGDASRYQPRCVVAKQATWGSVFKDRTATLGMLNSTARRTKNEERGVSPSSLDRNLGDHVRRFYPIADASLVKARHVFTKHKGLLRTSDAIRLGLHPRTLYNLRDRGEARTSGRGIYRLSTSPPLTSPDLVSLAIRIRTTTAFELDKPS